MSFLDRFRAPQPLPASHSQPRFLAPVDSVDLEHRWLSACAYLGLGRMISTPAGPTMSQRPKVVRIVQGPAPYLVVQLHPGQLMADLEDRRDELARALGCWGLRFSDRGGDHVRVDLLQVDPLARTVPYLPEAIPDGHVVFGRGEDGRLVSRALDDLTHIGIQGATNSGKSVQAYSLIAQLVTRFHGLVDLVGIDPTSLLFRPLGEHPRGWRVSGTKDAVTRYPAVLRELVEDMDHRIEHLPLRCDAMPISQSMPRRVVVLEELNGISRNTGYRQSGAPSETQKLIGRLASEGRKAGYRLVVISQRLGADCLSTDTRDQLLTRLSFSARDLATVRMLSPDAEPADVAALVASPPGTALVEAPGLPLGRMRGVYVGGYGEYCDLVGSATTRSGRYVGETWAAA